MPRLLACVYCSPMKTASPNRTANGTANCHIWSSANATSTLLNLKRKARSSLLLLLLPLDLLSQPFCLRASTTTALRLRDSSFKTFMHIQ